MIGDSASLGQNNCDWTLVREVVRKLEESWKTTGNAELARFVPLSADSHRQRALVELVKVDQEYRWQVGQRPLLETYLTQWPDLADNPAIVVELLGAECLTRAILDALPSPEELQSRFPNEWREVDLAAIRAEADDERQSGARPAAADTSGTRLTDTASEAGARLPLAIGSQFGRYEIRGLLGRGGMGTVYRAYDAQLGREVALKVPRFDPVVDRVIVDRFLREAHAAAVIRHPNICPIYDAGRIDGTYYLTMALIEGQSLAAWMEGRQVAPREAAELVRKLAHALDAVHASGTIHRDIKASNVMIDQSGEPVLMDFGLARPIRTEEHLTTSGSFLGTPAYMSPEQVNNAPVDARSDVYGLGVLLYQLLTGGLPFAGPLTQVLVSIAHAEPAKPRTIRPDVDAGLERICLKALAKKPAERYQSARELAETLQQYLQAPPHSIGLPPRKRGFGWLAAAVAGCLLLAGIVIYVNTGEGTLVLEVNQADVAVSIDGKRVEITSPRDEISLSVGRHRLEVTKDGFQTYTEAFTIRRGGKVELSSRVKPAPVEPRSVAGRVQDLALLRTRVEAKRIDDPFDRTVSALRSDLVDFRCRHYGTVEAVEAAELMSRLPWPVDSLSRDRIDPYELGVAGGGDPGNAPLELVGMLGDSRLKHWNIAESVAFTPDGKLLATGSDDGHVNLWDLDSGTLRRTFYVGSTVRSIAISTDGKLLGVAGVPGLVELWNLTDGKLLNRLPGHQGWVHAVAFSPDGRLMATGDMFSKIKIWDLNAQSERLDLVGHTGPVTCLAFSPNSESLASGGHDLTAFLWDVRSGAKKSVFPAQGHAIQSVAFFPDGSQLVIGEGVNQEGCQGHIRIWNTVNSELLRTITLPEQGMVNCVAYAPDGRTLASATWEDGSVTLWDTATGRRLQVLRAGGRDARSVAFDPQGRTLASCGVDGQVCIWRRSENNQWVQAFDELGKTRITTAAVSPDGRIIAAGSHRAICFWDLGPDLVDGEVGVHEEVACLEFSPDGSLLACATQRSGKLLLFSTRDRKPLLGIDADPKAARVVAFTPDGQIVATGCANGSVKLWEVGSGVLRHRFDCHTSEVVDVAFSPDGRLLASIGLVGHAAKVWTVATGQEYVTLPGHEATDPVEGKAVAFSPDGRTLEITRYSRHSAAWGTERWDLTGEPILHEFVAREASGGHVRAYAPDGGSVASVSQGTVRVRNSRNGELQRAITITPHLGIVRQLLFTPDGRHLITANGNGTVYILRLAPYQSRAAK